PFHSSEREEKMLSWKFSRKGATGFSWASTADEVTAGVTASGLTAIVTGTYPSFVLLTYPSPDPSISFHSIRLSGASSGIGAETARVLAARGAHVVMAVRNLAAGDTVRQAVLAETPAASVDLMELDVSSLASVRNFAADFAARGLPLNILVNNAGIMATPFTLSKDGIEMQFATNHVGHFLLTHLVLDTMKKTSRESNVEGRIVIVASEGHRVTYKEGIRFAKINDEQGYV
uniref:Short-chain dehydrogenase TIC 32, chloroplastic n=1 Tax=Aegilops tauschii subsp. strangulata TaxID=200361 RepID=A0A453GY46_AEGTS